MNLEIAAVIAVVVVIALLVAKRVGFKLTKEGVSLSADKNKLNDTTEVEKNKKSKIDIETRKGQDISVKENENSDVKIK